MQRQPIEALMTRVTQNKLSRDEGLKKVKNLFTDDNEVLATKTKLTLTDPLLLTRIKTPVRARTCGHFQVKNISKNRNSNFYLFFKFNF